MNGYEQAADNYEANRPGYPAPAVDCLLKQLHIDSSSAVLDLAAGTGKLTRALLNRAGPIIAVEPVAAMRKELDHTVPGVKTLEGTAESIPLPSSSIDAVVVGQAFHWFNGAKALEEINRVLKAKAWLGLIWNIRDESAPAQQRVAGLLSRYRGGSRTFRNSGWQTAFSESLLFTPLASAEFLQVHRLDREGLIGLIMSMSYMPLLPAADQAEAADEAGRIFDEHGGPEATIALPYTTRVYWTRSRRLD